MYCSWTHRFIVSFAAIVAFGLSPAPLSNIGSGAFGKDRFQPLVAQLEDHIDVPLRAIDRRHRRERLPPGEEKKPDDTPLPGFEWNAEISSTVEVSRNFDLDHGSAGDVATVAPEFYFEMGYEPVNWFEVFTAFTLSREIALLEEGENSERETSLTVDELYAEVSDIFDVLGLRVGRQSFFDERQWLYSAELDAVRLFLNADPYSFEFSVSRDDIFGSDIFIEDGATDNVNNYVFYGEYSGMEEASLGAYVFARDDLAAGSGTPVLIGIRSVGQLSEQWLHWVELAYRTGRENGETLSAYALDVAATYKLDLPLRPYISAGYAFGSGNSDPIIRSTERSGNPSWRSMSSNSPAWPAFSITAKSLILSSPTCRSSPPA